MGTHGAIQYGVKFEEAEDRKGLLAAQLDVKDIQIVLEQITRNNNITGALSHAHKETVAHEAFVTNTGKTVNNIAALINHLEAQQKTLTENLEKVEVVADKIAACNGTLA